MTSQCIHSYAIVLREMATELSCVRGYHQSRWTAVTGEKLTCCRDLANASDPFAVAVKGSEIVGHVPRVYYHVVVYLCSAALLEIVDIPVIYLRVA